MLSVECDLPVGGHLREFEQTLAYKAYANTPEVTQNVSGILSPEGTSTQMPRENSLLQEGILTHQQWQPGRCPCRSRAL